MKNSHTSTMYEPIVLRWPEDCLYQLSYEEAKNSCTEIFIPIIKRKLDRLLFSISLPLIPFLPLDLPKKTWHFINTWSQTLPPRIFLSLEEFKIQFYINFIFFAKKTAIYWLGGTRTYLRNCSGTSDFSSLRNGNKWYNARDKITW